MNAGTDTSSEPTESGDNRAVGAQLRAARDRRQLKLEEVARELHLDPGIIRAIEADDQSALPAPIFVQGYVRNYARLVGLPEEELIRQFRAQGTEPPPLSVIRTSSKLPLFQLPSARLIRNTILIMLGVILVWLAYPFAERLLASRNGKTEEQLPGRLELPPAFDSEQLFQQPEPAEHPLRLP